MAKIIGMDVIAHVLSFACCCFYEWQVFGLVCHDWHRASTLENVLKNLVLKHLYITQKSVLYIRNIQLIIDLDKNYHHQLDQMHILLKQAFRQLTDVELILKITIKNDLCGVKLLYHKTSINTSIVSTPFGPLVPQTTLTKTFPSNTSDKIIQHYIKYFAEPAHCLRTIQYLNVFDGCLYAIITCMWVIYNIEINSINLNIWIFCVLFLYFVKLGVDEYKIILETKLQNMFINLVEFLNSV